MFFVRFETVGGLVRTITIGNFDRSVRFKGTALADFKWAADYVELDALEIDSERMMTVRFRDGRDLSIGTVAPQCVEKLKGYEAIGLSIEFSHSE